MKQFLGAKELRINKPDKKILKTLKKNPIYIIVENVLDTYNVGAIFRLADAAAVSKVILVGDTATPTDPKLGHKIHKASCGVWQWVDWEYAQSIGDALSGITNYELRITNIKSKLKIRKNKTNSQLPFTNYHLQVVAIEQHKKSIPYSDFNYHFPLVLILGHETTGVSREALQVSDAIVEIPMFGVNKSLNVMVSLAIVLWHILGKKLLKNA
jgi:tRNA G18 (ribose-2'-O)-methylase SpoU